MEAKFPHFFKIIGHESIRDGMLAIPKKFVRKYGDELQSSVVLKVPTGEQWRVELMKRDGEIWFANDGWQEFVKNYSLAFGSLLVFEFDKENYHFNVIVFDKSASEITYPYNNLEKEFQEPIRNEEEVETEVSTQILNIVGPSEKTGKEKENSKRNYQGTKTSGGLFIKKQRLDDDNACCNLTAAEEFSSIHPFFSKVISSTQLQKNIVYVPSNFASNIKRSRENATLQVGNRCWSVKLILQEKWKVCQLSRGWGQFARENSLQVGDVCVFELIDSKAVVINVSIFRHFK